LLRKFQGRLKNTHIFILLTSQYSIRPIFRLNIDSEKFSSNAKTGEFDYLRRFKATENTEREQNWNI
jgi:hypothetical protein